ncbi:hypothetical protein A0H81_08301 [Grifola frondosa]|uniref:Uncharacterized protein n=1 Tax=Grifola frondosa TaxID=5627 RepID=A0A1C7M4P9_GRIFR|nr:hypothetical protein A0H81_08301 [Grifola frondosa]
MVESEPSQIVLNSPNLRKHVSSKVDKDSLLQAYVLAQKANLSIYAAEGRTASASWDTQHATQTASAQTVHRPTFGFDSPILRPRVPNSRTKDKSNAREAMVTEKSTGGDRVTTDTIEHKQAAKRSKQTPAAEKTQSTLVVGKGKIQISKRNQVRGTARKESSKKRQHVQDEDEERIGARTKRAIVEPRAADDRNEEGSLSVGKNKGKKSKGLTMPAGLALMHGFSATNIGKERLTLKRDPTIGVFNKGKASAKTSVNKSGTKKKLRSNMFSEEFFLNSSRRPPKDDPTSASGSSSESDSDTSPDAESSSDHSKLKNARKALGKAPRKNKPKTTSHNHDAATFDSQDEHGGVSSDAIELLNHKRRKIQRTESVVWDIELDGASLVSGSRSSRKTHLDRNGSVVLDTRGNKWVIASPDNRNTSANTNTEAARLIGSYKSSSPSLCPSQSASQVAVHDTPGDAAHLTNAHEDLPEAIPDEMQDISLALPSTMVAPADIPTSCSPAPLQNVQRTTSSDVWESYLALSPISPVRSIAPLEYDIGALNADGIHAPYFYEPSGTHGPLTTYFDRAELVYEDVETTLSYVPLESPSLVGGDTMDISFREFPEGPRPYLHEHVAYDALQSLEPFNDDADLTWAATDEISGVVHDDADNNDQSTWQSCGELDASDIQPLWSGCHSSSGDTIEYCDLEARPDSPSDFLMHDHGSDADQSISNGSSNVIPQRFSQGRALLIGLPDCDSGPTITNVVSDLQIGSSSTPVAQLVKAEYVAVAQAKPSVSEPPRKLYNVYTTAEDIQYLPESALKDGLGMVKTLKSSIKKLELGSKLRRDVWLHKIER